MSVSIPINCPACQLPGKIDIPPELFAKKGTGLVTVNVPKDFICEHAFQIFIDRNGKVRGYQNIDFQLEMKKEIKESIKSALQELKKANISIQGIMSIITSNIFLRIVKCSLLGIPITIISNNQLLTENLKSTFLEKFPEFSKTHFINELDYSADYSWTGLVVDLNFKMVNQDPSLSRFTIGQILSSDIWRSSDPTTQHVLFQNFVDRLLLDYNMFEQIVKNEKEKLKLPALGKVLEKDFNLKLEKDRLRFLYEMLQFRNPKLSPKVDTFDNRVKSMNLF
ncbi:MAG: hypothetical protein RBG13Loki_0126 [Promethearchaeota archaeon CR_4]|nr:MAG: hypothetical protein RBG13Loki_0126 [Candidatus Lokiarchaeota archaeon CR_4]